MKIFLKRPENRSSEALRKVEGEILTLHFGGDADDNIYEGRCRYIYAGDGQDGRA